MKTNDTPPNGYIVITPGTGPYDRDCEVIAIELQGRLSPSETLTIHHGEPPK